MLLKKTEKVVNKKAHDFTISIIIAAYNKPKELYNTIQSLLVGSVVPNEIVVSDQSTNDEIENILKPFMNEECESHIKYVKSHQRGLSANRNNALKAAEGDFIASVDDDVTVDNKWLELMLTEWISVWNKGTVLITGRILPSSKFKEDSLVTALRISNERTIYEGKAIPMGIFIGAQFGASRKLFEALGEKPFDEELGVGTINFPGADDDDFAYRVQKNGFKIIYEPSIFVVHHTERIDDWRKLRYTRAIGNGAELAKHFLNGDLSLIITLLKVISINFMKGFRAVLKRQEPEGSARLMACYGFLEGFIKWIFYTIISKPKI